MKLQGKRVAVLAENNYQEMELWYPLLRLREAGAETFVVGTGSADTYKSKLGYPVQVDVHADQVSAAGDQRGHQRVGLRSFARIAQHARQKRSVAGLLALEEGR